MRIEELNALKEEVETLNKKLAELSEDELKQVTGGGWPSENSHYAPDENCQPDYEIYRFQ